MKLAAICLFLVCTVFTSALATEENKNSISDAIFGEKLVLCEIDFQPDSYTLSQQAKAVLDGVVDQLENIDTETKTIRIEGFWGRRDTFTESPRLSMMRALAVEDYFRLHHEVSFERFLTGHKSSGPDCQVKIFVYENPWYIEDEPVRIANKGDIDGSS